MRNLISLALRSAKKRYILLLLTVSALTISMVLLMAVDSIRHSAKSGFGRTVSGTDLLVGSRGSELGLLLHTLFHIGNASQSISWESYEAIEAMDEVAWSIPLLTGDSHRGFRVVGTSADFWEHFRFGNHEKLTFAEGRAFHSGYEAVIGAQVAKALGYKPDSNMVLTHGTAHIPGHDHDDKPFVVVGILQPTGTAVDKAIYTPLEGIEALHTDYRAGRRMPLRHSAQKALHHHSEPEKITAMLIGLKSRAMSLQLQRRINTFKPEPLTALIPSRTANELWQSLGRFEQLLQLISMMVAAAAVTGMLSMLLATLNERRREMAILRAVGAHWYHIIGLFIVETAAVLAVSTVIGVVILSLLHNGVSGWLLHYYGVVWYLDLANLTTVLQIASLWLIALLVTLIPGFRAYNRALHDGLQIKI